MYERGGVIEGSISSSMDFFLRLVGPSATTRLVKCTDELMRLSMHGVNNFIHMDERIGCNIKSGEYSQWSTIQLNGVFTWPDLCPNQVLPFTI